MDEQFAYIDVQAIRPSPFNPRKTLDDVDDLAASITEVGVQQPAVVRPLPGKKRKTLSHELVFGHRRHAAAKRAGLKQIPCIVRDYTDDQVIEIQIIENNQRKDVDPLEEADGFGVLQDRGKTIQDIADAVGRSLSYVHQRLQLRQLSEAGRSALDDQTLTLGAAMALAKVPSAIQEDTLEQLKNAASTQHVEYSGGEMTRQRSATIRADWAARFIRNRVMVKLAEAPWALDDAELVPTAGPCTTCPKNTRSQASLFPDEATEDLCLDGDCYRSKMDAHWQQLKAKGGDTFVDHMTDLEGGAWRWVPGDDHLFIDGERRSVAEIAQRVDLKHLMTRDHTSGRPVRVYLREDLWREGERIYGGEEREAAVRERQEQARLGQIRADRRNRLIQLIPAGAERLSTEDALELVLRGVLQEQIGMNGADEFVEQLNSFGTEVPGYDENAEAPENDKAAAAWVAASDSASKLRLGLLVLSHVALPGGWLQPSDEVDVYTPFACELLGLDVEAIDREVEADMEAREQAA